ncbi:uncharacterized protein LOC132637853 [Lycium barbarum]|uniref:uncharacterized protein LOC132637853 n=1 Tax=Lycium barbarum TaxID=112863 RepID=UPI00293E5136|nr:uncharacterized protein LOC132637853 [Lycium barbarum]
MSQNQQGPYFAIRTFPPANAVSELNLDHSVNEIEVDISERILAIIQVVEAAQISKNIEKRTYHARDAMNIDVNEGDADVEKEEACCICLIEYQDEDTIGTLQCGHEFHVKCISKWLQRKKISCMYLREYISLADEHSKETELEKISLHSKYKSEEANLSVLCSLLENYYQLTTGWNRRHVSNLC